MDNNGNFLAPVIVKPVNKHDTALFLDSIYNLLTMADELLLPIENAYITFDSAFDSESNRVTLRYHKLRPMIKPNPRNTKNPIKLEQMFEGFDEKIYKERFTVERCFAWQHVYRKLVIRYERLQETYLGFRHLAYSMINFRSVFTPS